jgi:adenylate kinase
MKLVLIGPQGSGKGTQAKLLAEKFGIPHISTGDVFRETAASGSALGNQIKALIDSGRLVPDDIVLEMLKSRFLKPDTARGFVLDGFPRNVEQARALESISRIDAAILIDIPDREAVRRIGGRRHCPVCNNIFGVDYIKEECGCGQTIVQRADDREEVVRKRLSTYNEKTRPVLDFYEKKGLLKRINGEQSIEDVFRDICGTL